MFTAFFLRPSRKPGLFNLEKFWAADSRRSVGGVVMDIPVVAFIFWLYQYRETMALVTSMDQYPVKEISDFLLPQ